MINGLESTKFTLTLSDLDDINVIAQSYDIYDRRVRERGQGTISEGNGVRERFPSLGYALRGMRSSMLVISGGWDSWLPLWKGEY